MSLPLLSWESTVSDFEEASQLAILRCYYDANPTKEQPTRVRRLAKTIVAKRIGIGGEHEYRNQQFAWKVLNGTQLRVPKPIRYFETSSDTGLHSSYIIMEYLDGIPLHEAGTERNVEAACDAIRFLHVHTTTSTSPGALWGSHAEGFPWGQNGTSPFNTIEDLQRRVNSRLARFGRDRKQIPSDYIMDLRHEVLVLCHMDLALRNILVLHDGVIAIVDWSSLAYYPAVFESACLSYLSDISPMGHRRLLDAILMHISGHAAESGIFKLRIVQDISIRYLF